MSTKLRIHHLAKELGTTSKEIIRKCLAEGVTVKNHMDVVSSGLETKIREWFHPNTMAPPNTGAAQDENPSPAKLTVPKIVRSETPDAPKLVKPQRITPEIRRPLHIKPPGENFQNARQLEARFDDYDPRLSSFVFDQVTIDLRDCKFVRPSAALWCVVYLALARARGAECELLVPLNIGVCVHLKASGFVDMLKTLGVRVDDRNVKASGSHKTILPISRFETTGEATEVTNRAFEELQAASVGAANLTAIVTELFGELTLNAIQHSDSPIGAYACVQFYEFSSGSRFVCTVADGGVGVLASLYRNEKLRTRVHYDWDALELAVRERVSGTGDPHRGIGLYGVSEDVRQPGRSLLLHSGMGSLEISEQLETTANRTRLFPGTLAFLSIPA